MDSSGDGDRAEELRKTETGEDQSSPDGFTVGGKDVAEEAPRLGEGPVEVGNDIQESTERQEAESESVEDSVFANQIRLHPIDTTFAEGGEKAVVVEGRFEPEEEKFSSEWTDVGAHRKKGKAQRGSLSRTPPTSALSRCPPLSVTPIRLPHATVSRPQPINVSAKAAAEQQRQSKAQNPGCRQPDGGTRLDVRTRPKKQESHVRAGGGPYEQAREPRATDCQYTRQALLDVYRQLLPTAAFSTQGLPDDPDVICAAAVTPFALLPLSVAEEQSILHSPACAGIRRPEAHVAPVVSTNLEAGANVTGSAVFTRETSPAGDSKEGPVVPKPQTPNPQASSPQTILGSQEGGKGTVTAVGQTVPAGDSDNITIVPRPQAPKSADSQAVKSRLGVPEAHQIRNPVRAPSKPRTPYNPLARTPPRTSSSPTRQSASSEPTRVPPASRPLSAERTAPSFGTSTEHSAAMTSDDVPDRSDDLLSLLTGGFDTENRATPAAGSGAQRSLGPESDMPSIMAMLLPAEGTAAHCEPLPPDTKSVSPPASHVHDAEVDKARSTTEGMEASHVAASAWEGTSASGPGSWGESNPMPVHIRAALEQYEEQKAKEKPRSAARKAAVDNLREDVDCCICFENPKNAALVPCGHRFCLHCSNLIHETRGNCPLCNKKIESVLKLFI